LAKRGEGRFFGVRVNSILRPLIIEEGGGWRNFPAFSGRVVNPSFSKKNKKGGC
jgi:hypothetical protein